MRRSVPQFVLFITLAGISPLAALLPSASACYAQSQNQQDQHNQPGQTPAQQPSAPPQQQQSPSTTPPRPSTDPDALRNRPRKRRCFLRKTTQRPHPLQLPKTSPKKPKPACSRPKTIPCGIPSTLNRILT